MSAPEVTGFLKSTSGAIQARVPQNFLDESTLKSDQDGLKLSFIILFLTV